MSDAGGLTVLDGSLLRAADLSLPDPDVSFTGAQLLQIAESGASSLLLLGLSLPQHLKASAVNRLGIADEVSFRGSELDGDEAARVLRDYVTAIADELRDDPLVVAVLDGKTLRLYLEDEDDFAMLAENLFTDLDSEDKGKISKNELQNALIHMGVELGIPPFSEYPLLVGILKKHTNVEKEDELGQAQFAQLLQQVLQELAEALAEKHVVVVQNIKLFNGSKIRKLLISEEKVKAVTRKILLEINPSSGEIHNSMVTIRVFLEENEKDLGLPSSKADDLVGLLYDEVFTDVGKSYKAVESEDEIALLVKEILLKFAEKLEANPVFQDRHD